MKGQFLRKLIAVGMLVACALLVTPWALASTPDDPAEHDANASVADPAQQTQDPDPDPNDPEFGVEVDPAG